MKICFFLFLFGLSLIPQAQTNIQLEKGAAAPFQTDRLIKIDNFGTVFHVRGQELIKSSGGSEMNFSNVQLGEITNVDAFNPLKVNIFYDAFNTVIILDNRLAEIAIINFNELSPFRLVTHVAAGFDNTIWIYNQGTQQLELYNYLSDRSRITTLPIEGEVLDLCSNFNYGYLLTDQALYTYNYFGNLVDKKPNPGFTEIVQSNGRLICRMNNMLYYIDSNSTDSTRLELPELLIKQFFLTDETLYIYDGEILHQFHLKGN